jgi:hypothetical protein
VREDRERERDRRGRFGDMEPKCSLEITIAKLDASGVRFGLSLLKHFYAQLVTNENKSM